MNKNEQLEKINEGIIALANCVKDILSIASILIDTEQFDYEKFGEVQHCYRLSKRIRIKGEERAINLLEQEKLDYKSVKNIVSCMRLYEDLFRMSKKAATIAKIRKKQVNGKYEVTDNVFPLASKILKIYENYIKETSELLTTYASNA